MSVKLDNLMQYLERRHCLYWKVHLSGGSLSFSWLQCNRMFAGISNVFSFNNKKPTPNDNDNQEIIICVTQKPRGRTILRLVNVVFIDVNKDPGLFHLFALPSSAC